MSTKKAARRPRGTGSIYIKQGAYYGKWRVNGRQVDRRLGAVRSAVSVIEAVPDLDAGQSND